MPLTPTVQLFCTYLLQHLLKITSDLTKLGANSWDHWTQTQPLLPPSCILLLASHKAPSWHGQVPRFSELLPFIKAKGRSISFPCVAGMSRAGQCGSAWSDSPERGAKGPFWYTTRHSKTSVCPPRIRWRMQQGCSSRAPMDGLLPPLLLSSLGDHTPHCPSHTSLWLHHLPLQGIPVLPSSSQDFSHISEFLLPFTLTVPHMTLHRSA